MPFSCIYAMNTHTSKPHILSLFIGWVEGGAWLSAYGAGLQN